MDFVQWTGPSPQQDPYNFQKINYKHDVYGRRIEKKVDGFSTRYLYDGDQVIAEYDGNNNLLRKYIYGPGIDQPVCMIEQAVSETWYYHYDGLGSVVALSDSSGDTVQTYEYSVFGQVAVEDINHPNPYMFAGRRFDIETGLYYNRARYYNPYTGRFMQADPIGYGDGMNLYAYCRNNPLVFTDPMGLLTPAIAFYHGSDFYEREVSDDCMMRFDYDSDEAEGMSGPEYVLYALQLCKDLGIEPEEIYFYGHGSTELIFIGDHGVGGRYTNDIDFWAEVGELAPNATINLRSCAAAAPSPRGGMLIEQVALASGLTVTGSDGCIWTTIPFWVTDTDTWEGYGPDYELRYGYGFYRSEVQEDGTVATECYWKNERYYDPETERWYNPWGEQPY